MKLGDTPLRSVHGWLIILSRFVSNPDTFPVEQNWTAYKDGFGDVTSDYWLGLERIARLTNAGPTYRLRFLLQPLLNDGYAAICNDNRLFEYISSTPDSIAQPWTVITQRILHYLCLEGA